MKNYCILNGIIHKELHLSTKIIIISKTTCITSLPQNTYTELFLQNICQSGQFQHKNGCFLVFLCILAINFLESVVRLFVIVIGPSGVQFRE